MTEEGLPPSSSSESAESDGASETQDYRASYLELKNALDELRQGHHHLVSQLTEWLQQSEQDKSDKPADKPSTPSSPKSKRVRERILQLEQQLLNLQYQLETERLLQQPQYKPLSEAYQSGILKSRSDFPDVAAYERYLQSALNLIGRLSSAAAQPSEPASNSIAGATPPVANMTARPQTPPIRHPREIAAEMVRLSHSDPEYKKLERELELALSQYGDADL